MSIESGKTIGQLQKQTLRRVGHDKPTDRLIALAFDLLQQIPFVSGAARAEALRLTVTTHTIELPRLPAAFDGLSIAFLTDFHAGDTASIDFIEHAIARTNALKPDLILLGGDYITKGTRYLPSTREILRELRAPLGVYGVLGNHDYWDDPDRVRSMLAKAGIADVTNSGRWIMREGSRLRIAGVADLWEGNPNLHAALAGVEQDETAILLAHNPDYAMGLADPRVGLVLSGHTHGGQIRLPKVGALVTNSKYGQHHVSGLIPFESFQLYVSRGLGTVVIPMRLNCPPEISLLKLCAPSASLSASAS